MTTVTPSARPGRRPRRAATALVALATLGLAAAVPLQDGEQDLDTTRTALEQWVETRRIISHEKREWVLGKELLQERIEVVQREIEALRESIAEAESSIAEADGKRVELVERNEELESATAVLGEVAERVEGKLSALLPRVPEPVRDRVKPLSQQIPEAGEETKLSLSQRFQNVIGVLNEVNKFNREVSVASEVRALPDGSTAEVTALYVGVGHGYYVTANGLSAGVGRSTADGWEWTPANDIAADVARAVKILKNEEAAAFISLPVEID